MVKLQRISIFPVAKILCLFHAVIGLVIGLVITLNSFYSQEENGLWTLGPWAVLICPALNAVLGFLTGAALAWSYNLFAQWLGPIEIEVTEEHLTLPTSSPV